MKDLKQSRQEIDEIDQQLIELFEKRMHLAKDVVNYKMAHHLDIFQKDREMEVIDKNVSRIQDKDLESYVKDFIISNMNLSKKYQTTFLPLEEVRVAPHKTEHLIVGYQGVPGSFSNEALNTYFGDVVEVNYPRFEDVFKALAAKEIDYGVLPLENSTTGAINDNYDLITQYGFYIIGEQSISISQHLLGVKGASLEDIKTVYSHPQGLLQTSNFLNAHHIDRETYPNTAMAAQYASITQDKSIGAIASSKAAELYNLDILGDSIQNDKNNHTRFMIIGRKLESEKDATRISFVFTLRHEAGALYEVMKIVKEHSINMARIESRPLPHAAWQYYFYVDIDGNLHDPNVSRCLEEIKACTYTFRILGNYERK